MTAAPWLIAEIISVMPENTDDHWQAWKLRPAEALFNSCCSLSSGRAGKGKTIALMYPVSLLQGAMVTSKNTSSRSVEELVPH